MTAPITFGSACSGIEAASAAWHPLGWRAAWLAEIEPFPSAVLAHRYLHAQNLGDMNRVPALVRAGVAMAPDVLIGGTPCQAFSVAGLGNSLSDARGQLTLSFVEIADAIDATRLVRGQRPVVILWENVPGVLSTTDNAFGCFLGKLAGEVCALEPPGRRWPNAGCVFGPVRTVAWRVLDAQYFGLAQRRARLFVVASAGNGADPIEILFECEGVRRDSAPRRSAGKDVAGTITAGAFTGGAGGRPEGAAAGHFQVTAYGGGNSTAIDVSTTRNAHASASGRLDFESETFVVQPALTVALRGRDGGATAELGDEVAGCLRASTGGGDKAHVLAPIAFDSRQDPISSTSVFGAPGSSSPQAQAVCVTGDIAHCLKAEGFDASEDGTGRGQPITTAGMAVRRLTPRECERLQGFPDDYTAVRVRGKPAADGPRYKALGNSMAVPCIRWLGNRIARELTGGAP